MLYLNIGFALLLLLSNISPIVNPQKAWLFAFLGIAYPYLLIINLIFIFLWLFRKMKRLILISCIAIIFGWGNLSNVFHFPGKKRRFEPSEQSFKVLSYNVRAFNRYKWLKTEKAEQTIFDFLNFSKADIICIQEYTPYKSEKLSDLYKDSLSNHIKLNKPDSPYGSGLATFSEFPIINKGSIPIGEYLTGCIFSDIVINDDTIRLYNTHLQSIHFAKEDYDLIDSLKLQYKDKHIQGIKNITQKMKEAYIKRSEQTDIISKHISTSPYPVILCGDFNDTPISYTHHKMKSNLFDAYRKSGSGLSNTYAGKLPSFRIDYILFNKLYKAYNYKRYRIKSSDHYPISCDFIKEE